MSSTGTSWWPRRAGGGGFDFVHDVHSFHDAPEDAVAPAARRGCGEVQKIAVHQIDEKLAGGRVRVVGARHGDGAAVVAQAVHGLVFDRGAGGLLLHARTETAALDHETGDNTMKIVPS